MAHSTGTTIRAALVQMSCVEDKQTNVKKAIEYLHAAADAGGIYGKSSIPITKTEWLEGYEKFYFKPG